MDARLRREAWVKASVSRRSASPGEAGVTKEPGEVETMRPSPPRGDDRAGSEEVDMVLDDD